MIALAGRLFAWWTALRAVGGEPSSAYLTRKARTYYWTVTALTKDGEPIPRRRTRAREVPLTVSWRAVEGAESYTLYRT